MILQGQEVAQPVKVLAGQACSLQACVPEFHPLNLVEEGNCGTCTPISTCTLWHVYTHMHTCTLWFMCTHIHMYAVAHVHPYSHVYAVAHVHTCNK